jgi:putative CRISPR-associated protein (TIGR02619 family)
MTRYLCTVGTSASQQVMRAPDIMAALGVNQAPRLSAALVEQLGGEDATVRRMLPHFLALDHKDETTLRSHLSAEVHSLVRMKLDAQDEVFLFSTDTPDGMVCARLVAAYLTGPLGIPNEKVRVERIKGLQVDDGSKFRREGIINYINTVRRLGDERAWVGVVLNPTGGFKALIPYTTLLGMLCGAPVRYIFDNGRELIELPPLPIEFNLLQLAPRERALAELEKKTEMTEDRFWAGASHQERNSLAALVETTRPGWVTLSGLGLLVLERLRAADARGPIRIFLSLAAWKDLHAAPKDWDCLGQLERMARSTRAQINERIEKKHVDASLWFKPGRTTDRWRVEWEGDTLLVYRILKHIEYERALNHTQWVRTAYAPFIPWSGVVLS